MYFRRRVGTGSVRAGRERERRAGVQVCVRVRVCVRMRGIAVRVATGALLWLGGSLRFPVAPIIGKEHAVHEVGQVRVSAVLRAGTGRRKGTRRVCERECK